MEKIVLRWRQLKTILLIYIFRLFSNFHKHWVVYERGTDARDNGYWFYKYLKESHPEIKVYYIIDRHSADYHKVKEDAVQLGSIKNYWVMATAKKRVSSHYGMGIPFVGLKVYDICGLNKNYYFLQHGIIYARIEFCCASNCKVKLFVCGAKPESDFVENTYGHPKGVVEYTGLARFDHLHDIQIKRQILVMPTWRGRLNERSKFVESEYLKNWQALLSDKALIDRLEKENIQLVFYVHYEFQKYVDCFKSYSDNVIIARFEEYDVQTLLKESALLVTDFSSVFFDFAYMRKPIVYFHFDKDRFFLEERGSGSYFTYEEMGFGSVCQTVEETVSQIISSIDDNFELKNIYAERIKGFFPLYDKNNCERIYRAIISR